jgi:hypothetical protein
MLTTTVAVIVAICLAGVTTGGTYALWSKSQSTNSAATISSGTASLVVTTALAMPATPMYPGLTVYGSAVLQNTGTVPLTLRTTGLAVPTSNSFSQAMKVGFATAATAANCAVGTVNSAWVYSTFASPSVAPIGTPFAVGTSAVLCVSVELSSTADNAAEGQSATDFAAVVDGIQG